MQHEPVFQARFGHHTLRFFTSPLWSPDIPWCSVDDLIEGLTTKEFAMTMSDKLHISPARHAFRTIETASGPTKIIPFTYAQKCVVAMENNGITPPVLSSMAFNVLLTRAITTALPDTPPDNVVALLDRIASDPDYYNRSTAGQTLN